MKEITHTHTYIYNTATHTLSLSLSIYLSIYIYIYITEMLLRDQSQGSSDTGDEDSTDIYHTVKIMSTLGTS